MATKLPIEAPKGHAFVEMFAVVDSDGDYAVGTDEGEAAEAYDNNIGGHAARRTIKVRVMVKLPTVVELEGVADESGEVAQLV